MDSRQGESFRPWLTSVARGSGSFGGGSRGSSRSESRWPAALAPQPTGPRRAAMAVRPSKSHPLVFLTIIHAVVVGVGPERVRLRGILWIARPESARSASVIRRYRRLDSQRRRPECVVSRRSCRILWTDATSGVGSASSISATKPVTTGAAALTAPATPTPDRSCRCRSNSCGRHSWSQEVQGMLVGTVVSLDDLHRR